MTSSEMDSRVVITGLGMIGVFGVGREDFSNFIEGRKQKRKISDFNFDDYIDTALFRRADYASCFASIAAKFALKDANLLDSAMLKHNDKFGAIVGTVHGALGHTIEYHKALILDNPATVSPSLFSSSVINSTVSYISNIFKIYGYTATVPGYAGTHQAIKLAVELITGKQLDICLVGGVDINNEFLVEAYSSCMDDSKLISGDFGGSGFLVLESFESASRRASRIYAEVLSVGIITADFEKLRKYRILPVKLPSLQSVDYVFSSAFYDKDSRMREALFLERLGQDKAPIFPCSNLFGCTFCAAESFQLILSAIKTENSYNKVLNNHISQTGANAYLLLGKCYC